MNKLWRLKSKITLWISNLNEEDRGGLRMCAILFPILCLMMAFWYILVPLCLIYAWLDELA